MAVDDKRDSSREITPTNSNINLPADLPLQQQKNTLDINRKQDKLKYPFLSEPHSPTSTYPTITAAFPTSSTSSTLRPTTPPKSTIRTKKPSNLVLIKTFARRTSSLSSTEATSPHTPPPDQPLPPLPSLYEQQNKDTATERRMDMDDKLEEALNAASLEQPIFPPSGESKATNRNYT
ncbi:hypothetical protein CBS101457_001049 [Exobasidium rhododendri]|nr:hypothetical protein CBS101457_001049 [Exobasidium rhododendri]